MTYYTIVLRFYVNIAPANRFSLLSQNLFDILLPFQVRPPTQVVGYEMVVVTTLTLDYHHSVAVGLAGDDLAAARRTNLAGVDELQFVINLAKCLA